jgi:hypothetical protein
MLKVFSLRLRSSDASFTGEMKINLIVILFTHAFSSFFAFFCFFATKYNAEI